MFRASQRKRQIEAKIRIRQTGLQLRTGFLRQGITRRHYASAWGEKLDPRHRHIGAADTELGAWRAKDSLEIHANMITEIKASALTEPLARATAKGGRKQTGEYQLGWV